jgi:uridine phosphorylase
MTLNTDLKAPPRRDAERPRRPAIPLIERDDFSAPSIFRPENMLRESRRQKGLAAAPVAPICILDPDGDMVRYVRQTKDAKRAAHWACYHTCMWEWEEEGQRFAIIGSAVGGSFAVLVAEQLFVSGCQFVISIASAGRIAAFGPEPFHIVIERALRDEGTSYHYLPPSLFVEADPSLLDFAARCVAANDDSLLWGTTWTTDAPFRETARTIHQRQRQGVLAVEMEAAALYAFGRACRRPVLCIAHVTNQLGCVEGDFEKGIDDGAGASLALVAALAAGWRTEHAQVTAALADVPA